MAFTAAHFLRMTPLVFSWVAILLAVLVLCAGNKPGVMEGYNIITVDIYSSNSPVSNKVHNALDARSPAPTNDCGESLSWLCDQMNSAASTAFMMTPTPTPVPVPTHTRTAGAHGIGVNNANPPVKSSTPQVADIGGRFYSLYTLAMCEGVIGLDGSHTTSQCYPYFTGDPATIPYRLSVANLSPHGRTPLKARSADPESPDPNDITLPYALLSALEQLTTLAKTVTVLWAVGLGCTGLAVFASIPAITVGRDDGDDGIPATYQWGVYINMVCASCAFAFLMLGALVGATGAKVAEGTIMGLSRAYKDGIGQTPVEDNGMQVLREGSGFGGVEAAAGTSWVGMSWGTVALMLVVLVYWVVRVVKLRKAKREEEESEDSSSVEEVPRPGFPGYPGVPGAMPRGPAPQGPPPWGPAGAGPSMPSIPGASFFFKTPMAQMAQMGRGARQ